MQNFTQASLNVHFFFENCHEDINADGNPDLRLHRVFAGAKKSFDAQILFDPLEKQLDLPTALVELWDIQPRHIEIVGEEYQSFVGERIAITDTPKWDRVVLGGLKSSEENGLIGSHPGVLVDWTRFDHTVFQIAFGPCYKKCERLVEGEKAGEVDVSTIEHVERAGFQNEVVEGVDIVNFSVGDMDEARDVSTQVDERVEFHRRLVRAEFGPWEQGQT